MTQLSQPPLSVVMPAYREAENLELLLPRLRATLSSIGTEGEILVVDAEERLDATAEVCKRHGATHLPRRGGPLYGHAVRTGIAASRGQWVVLMDSDGSHDPEFIATLWQHREEADLVIASRYIAGGQTENTPLLIWMSHTVNIIFRLVLGLKVADVSNSFRLYRGDDLRALSLKCQHFDIVEEILVKLAFGHRNYSILEVAAVFRRRQEGKTKRQLLRFAVGYAFTLGRLWLLKMQTLLQRH
ncbi:MAG: glycosyltransferase [Verrucomicrobiia bacterium]